MYETLRIISAFWTASLITKESVNHRPCATKAMRPLGSAHYAPSFRNCLRKSCITEVARSSHHFVLENCEPIIRREESLCDCLFLRIYGVLSQKLHCVMISLVIGFYWVIGPRMHCLRSYQAGVGYIPDLCFASREKKKHVNDFGVERYRRLFCYRNDWTPLCGVCALTLTELREKLPCCRNVPRKPLC
jgi:hypothetical protein